MPPQLGSAVILSIVFSGTVQPSCLKSKRKMFGKDIKWSLACSIGWTSVVYKRKLCHISCDSLIFFDSADETLIPCSLYSEVSEYIRILHFLDCDCCSLISGCGLQMLAFLQHPNLAVHSLALPLWTVCLLGFERPLIKTNFCTLFLVIFDCRVQL
jgi:hypothetical protein